MTREQPTIRHTEALLDTIENLDESDGETEELIIEEIRSDIEYLHEQLNSREQRIAELEEQLDKQILGSPSEQDEQDACDFCGTVDTANSLIDYNPIEDYVDGPPHASIPRTVLCYDCAQYVSDYLKARAGNVDQNENNPSPFEEADAEALLDRLKENESLVLVPEKERQHGIRFVDGEWLHAFTRIRKPMVSTNSRDEIRDTILNTHRLTLRKFDSSGWNQFKREPFDESLYNDSDE